MGTDCTVAFRRLPAPSLNIIARPPSRSTPWRNKYASMLPSFNLSNTFYLVHRSKRLSRSNTSFKIPKPRARPLPNITITHNN